MTLALARVDLPELGNYSLGNRDLFLGDTPAFPGLSREQWDRLVALTLEDLEFRQLFGGQTDEAQKMWAEVLMDQALGFMLLCGRHGGYSPSRLVDITWHVFMLDSWPYMQFCDVNFGAYIHHRPCLGKTTVELKRAGVRRTMDAMLEKGIWVIPEAWTLAKLNMQCDDDGCEGDTNVTWQ